MPQAPTFDPTSGQPLATLREHYHHYHDAFLSFGEAYPVGEGDLLLAYRRSLIAWYEMTVRRRLPTDMDTFSYLREAGTFFLLNRGPEQLGVNLPGAQSAHPLYAYLPEPVALSDRQQAMLEQFEEVGERCHDLLLLAYYHHLNDIRLGEVLEIPGGADGVREARHHCLFLIRERLRQSGLFSREAFLTDAEENLIDRYQRNELQTEERWDVELQRTERADFRAAIERQEEWLEAVRIAGRRQLHELMMEEETIYVEMSRPAVQRSRAVGSGYWMAAALLLLIIAVYGYREYLRPTDTRALALAYFEPYPNVVANSGSLDTADNYLERSFLPYDEGRWAAAYEELTTIVAAFPAARLYLGVTALAQSDPERATDWLETIGPAEVYHAPAQWYLALAYLWKRQTEPARALLLAITETNGHPYRSQAQRLLVEMG